MKRGGITLKKVAEATGESEQTVCRILNEDLISKIHNAGNQLVRDANEALTKDLQQEA
jgi:hypothetical protein